MVVALTNGTYVAPKAGEVTVAAVYASWSSLQGHISPKTSATRNSAWTSRVKPHWGDVAVMDVKTSAVKAWVAKMISDGVGAPGIENAFGVLRQVLGASVEDRRIPRNPCEGVRLTKRRHADRDYLSHSQVAALATTVKRESEVVRFLAYTSSAKSGASFELSSPRAGAAPIKGDPTIPTRTRAASNT
jgi:hypothetical protein